MNSYAPIVRSSYSKIDVDNVLNIHGFDLSRALEIDPKFLDDEHDHEHDDFDTFVVDLPSFEMPEQLTDRIEKLFEAHDILRLKGFAAIQGRDMRLLVQGVGTRLNTYFDRDWRSDETRTTRLVVIGLKGLDQPAIESILRG